MNTKLFCVIPCMLGVALLSGCAGFVSGDLRNIKTGYGMPACKDTAEPFQVIYKSDAKDDYGNQNIASIITSCTFEMIPTYWRSTVHSEATILRNGKPVFTKHYTSHIDKFYGILWAFILPSQSKSINALQADEGGGLRIEWGIRDRTLRKVVADYGGEENQFCFLDKQSTNTPPTTAPKPNTP